MLADATRSRRAEKDKKATPNENAKREETVNVGIVMLASLTVCFYVPLAALPIATASITGGVTLYRNTRDSALRGLALEAVMGGAIIIIAILFIVFFTFGWSYRME